MSTAPLPANSLEKPCSPAANVFASLLATSANISCITGQLLPRHRLATVHDVGDMRVGKCGIVQGAAFAAKVQAQLTALKTNMPFTQPGCLRTAAPDIHPHLYSHFDDDRNCGLQFLIQCGIQPTIAAVLNPNQEYFHDC